MNLVKIIKKCFEADSVLYTSHARREMKEEPFGKIYEEEVRQAVAGCEVIEEYPDDTPYPSALFFGKTESRRPLHLVCAYDDEEEKAIIITVYHPDPERWHDYKRRKK